MGSVDDICGAFLRTLMNLINMPRIDTRKRKSACKPPVVDLLLSMIEYVADYENSFRKIRQKEGVALAKELEVIFGRQEKLIPAFQKPYNM